MNLSNTKQVGVALVVALFLAGSGYAQRRVFTNDDITSAPPPAPAPTTAEAPAASPAPPASGDALPSTPMADLNQLKSIQQSLMNLYDMFAVRGNEAADPTLKQRWMEINQKMGEVIRANQLTIDELQARLGIEPEASSPDAPSAP